MPNIDELWKAIEQTDAKDFFADKNEFKALLDTDYDGVYKILSDNTSLVVDEEEFREIVGVKKKDFSVSDSPSQEDTTESSLEDNDKEDIDLYSRYSAKLTDLNKQREALTLDRFSDNVSAQSAGGRLAASTQSQSIAGQFASTLKETPELTEYKSSRILADMEDLSEQIREQDGSFGLFRVGIETSEMPDEEKKQVLKAFESLKEELGENSPFARKDRMNKEIEEAISSLDMSAYSDDEEGMKQMQEDIKGIVGGAAFNNLFEVAQDGSLVDKRQSIIDEYIQEKLEKENRPSFLKNLYLNLASGTDRAMAAMTDVVGFTTGLNYFDWYKGGTDGYMMRAEAIKERATRYNAGFEELMNDGKPIEAIGAAVSGVAESVPMMIPVLLSAWAGNPNGGLYVMGAMSTSDKYREIKDTNIPGWSKILNAVTSGLNEVVFERIFTVPILMRSKIALKEMGEQAVRGQIRKSAGTTVKNFFPYIPQIYQGGIEEVLTEANNNFVDKLTIDPNRKISDGLVDAFVGGVVMASVFASPQAASWAKNKFKSAEAKREYVKAISATLPDVLDTQKKVEVAEKILEANIIEDNLKTNPRLEEVLQPQLDKLNQEISDIVVPQEPVQETAPETREERIREIYKKTGDPRALKVETLEDGISIQIGQRMQPVVIKSEADIDTQITTLQNEAAKAKQIQEAREAEIAKDEEMLSEFPYRFLDQRFKTKQEFFDAAQKARDNGVDGDIFSTSDVVLGDITFGELNRVLEGGTQDAMAIPPLENTATEGLIAIQESAESNVKFFNELKSEVAETVQAETTTKTPPVEQGIETIKVGDMIAYDMGDTVLDMPLRVTEITKEDGFVTFKGVDDATNKERVLKRKDGTTVLKYKETQQAQETTQQEVQPIAEPKTLSDKINNLIILTLGFKSDPKSTRQVLADFIKENKAELSKINPRRIPKILNQLNTELTADQLQVVLGNLKDAVESAKEITTRKDIESEAKRLSESIKKVAKPKIKKDKKLVGARVVEEARVKKEVEKILNLSDTERQNYINKMERTANEGGEISTAEAIAIDYAQHLISSQEALDIINSKEFSLEEKADALETLKLNEAILKERDQDWLAERTRLEEARREAKAKKVAMAVEGSTKHRVAQLEIYVSETVAEINEGSLPSEALDNLLIRLRMDGDNKKADKIWKKLSPLLEDATMDSKKFKEALIKIIPSGKLPFDNITHEKGREGAKNPLSFMENFDGMVHTVFGRASRELAEQASKALSQPIRDARTKWEDMMWQGRQMLEKASKIFPNDLLGKPLAPSNRGKMGIYEFNDSKESLGVEMTLKERTRKEDGEEVITARARAVETYKRLSFANIAYLATFIKDPNNVNELGKKWTPDSVARLIARVDDVMNGESNLITPEKQKQLQDYVEFMETEFYPAVYDMVNKTYEPMFHTSLPRSAYAFVPRFVANRISNVMDMSLDGTEARQTASTFMSPPHIKRKVGSNDVDVYRNAMITADNYLRVMVDFAAFAEVKRDMTSFFHNKDVRMAVKRLNGGERYLQIFDAFLEDIPNPKKDVEANRNLALHLYRNMMLSVLRLNPGVFITQLGSTPNFVEAMKFRDVRRFVPGLQTATWLAEMVNLTEKGRADWVEYYNNFFESGFTKMRLNKGFDASLMATSRNLFIEKLFDIFGEKGTSAEAKMNAVNQFIMSDVGMVHIKIGDIVAFMGGKPVYVKLRDALIKDGFTVEDAQKKAMEVVTQAGALAQQSFYAEHRSHFQRRSDWSKWFYYFTTKFQYQQKINMAGRNIVRDVQRGQLPNVDDIDNLFRYGVLQSVIYKGLKWAIAMSLFARDTKEEEELKEGDLSKIGMYMEAAAPYLQGIPLVGDMADFLGRSWQGKDTYAFKVGGLQRVIDTGNNALELLKALDYDENGKLKPLTKRQERLLDNVLNEAYATTGINPRTMKKWIYLATGDPSDRKPIRGIDKEVRDAFERGLFMQEFVNENPDKAGDRAKKYQAYALNDYTDRKTRKDLEFLLTNYPTDRVVRYMEARRKDFKDMDDFYQNFIYKYSDPVDENGKVIHARLGTYEKLNKETGDYQEFNIRNVLSRNAVKAWEEKYLLNE